MGGDDDGRAVRLTVEECAFAESIARTEDFIDRSGGASPAANMRFATSADDQIDGIGWIAFAKNDSPFFVFCDGRFGEKASESASWEEGKQRVRLEKIGIKRAGSTIRERHRSGGRPIGAVFFSRSNVRPRHYHISL